MDLITPLRPPEIFPSEDHHPQTLPAHAACPSTTEQWTLWGCSVGFLLLLITCSKVNYAFAYHLSLPPPPPILYAKQSSVITYILKAGCFAYNHVWSGLFASGRLGLLLSHGQLFFVISFLLFGFIPN